MNEITCTIKKTGVTLKSFSQPTNLDDLDEALDLFDVKFKIILNKLIKNVPILGKLKFKVLMFLLDYIFILYAKVLLRL